MPLDLLPDRYARNAMLPEAAPASDANRVLGGFEQWLVVIGLCTHLGCRLPQEGAALRDGAGMGWFCPCHAAWFDASGRVRAGPARTNLAVPRYAFIEPLRIRIG
jgi:ubiquinol-cytochrome c reductase iron-sulfur subunit